MLLRPCPVRALTPDLAKIDVRVNLLSPGPVRTQVLEKTGMAAEQIKTQYAVFGDVLAAGRPAEMTKIALFLASEDSSFMFGAEIQADGGMNQTRWLT